MCGWMRQALSVEAVMQHDCVWHAGRGRMLALHTLRRVYSDKDNLRSNLFPCAVCLIIFRIVGRGRGRGGGGDSSLTVM